MAVVAFRGKDKVLKYFSDNRRPYWRVTLASDSRQVIGYNFDQTDMRKAEPALSDLLSSIEPDNVYSLETYDKTDKKPFGRADSVINFALTEAPTMGSVKTDAPTYDKDKFGRELELINTCASLRSEKGVLQFQYDQAQKEINELKALVAELERDLDELEEEAEEAEEGVSGTPADKFADVITGLVKDHGGKIVEHFTGGGEKIKEEIKLEGIKGPPDMPPIEKLCEILQKHDPELQYHLFRLVAIAQQKPDKFKFLLTALENS